jgi:Tfp pilus assembly protein PilX
MKTQSRRRQGGWVLVLVLSVLLLLSMLVAAFFAEAQDGSMMTRLDTAQQIATSHADLGMQEAIRLLRAAQTGTLPAVSCLDSDVAMGTCTTATIIPAGGPIDNGSTNELSNQGGLQYQYVIYRRATSDPQQPSNRYVVRATGYYGYTLTSNNLITSVLEAEFDVPNGKGSDVGCSSKCGGGSY